METISRYRGTEEKVVGGKSRLCYFFVRNKNARGMTEKFRDPWDAWESRFSALDSVTKFSVEAKKFKDVVLGDYYADYQIVDLGANKNKAQRAYNATKAAFGQSLSLLRLCRLDPYSEAENRINKLRKTWIGSFCGNYQIFSGAVEGKLLRTLDRLADMRGNVECAIMLASTKDIMDRMEWLKVRKQSGESIDPESVVELLNFVIADCESDGVKAAKDWGIVGEYAGVISGAIPEAARNVAAQLKVVSREIDRIMTAKKQVLEACDGCRERFDSLTSADAKYLT